MKDILKERIIPENSVVAGLRSQTDFYNHNNPKTVYNGLETIQCLGPKIWNIIPGEIKQSESITKFKQTIKTWTPAECPCRLCKTYVQGMGFIDLKY